MHDAAISNVHAIFAIDRAGITGEDGETHQGVFDIGFLQTIPHMTVLCPASFDELSSALRQAVYAYDGMVAVRYPKGGEGAYTDCCTDAPSVVLRSDEDAAVTLVGYGLMINEILDAAERLEAQGIRTEVIKLYRVLPLDLQEIRQSVQRTGRLVVAEDCVDAGSIGQMIVSALAQEGICPAVRLINIGDCFLPNGSVKDLRRLVGLDAEHISDSAAQICAGDSSESNYL